MTVPVWWCLGSCTPGGTFISTIPVAMRATGAWVVSLFLNLFGLAAGPFVAGMLSDTWGLTAALTAIPAFGLLAPLAFGFAARSYEADMKRAGEPTDEAAPTPMAGSRELSGMHT